MAPIPRPTHTVPPLSTPTDQRSVVYGYQITPVITAFNNLVDGDGNVTVAGNETVAGSLTANAIASTTTLNVGTNQTFTKEVNHTLTVSATTTAATVGANLSIAAAAGATSGNGGVLNLDAGAGGATAGSSGGALNITSGASGAGGGPSGAVTISTPAGTTSGDINITTGAASGTTSGNINITPGTPTSATVASATVITKGLIRNPLSTTTASGGTITGPQLVGGLIAATGATGNWQLPTAAQITTALGATPAGTNFEFVFNAAAMTAANTATLVVGSGMTVMSAPAITGGGALTVTQDTQVVGVFKIIFDTTTTCKISRIA